MKSLKIKHLRVLWVFATLMLISCTDLEENPDFTTQDNFFANAEQLELGVNAVYDGIGYGTQWFNHFYNRYVFECRVGYQVGWEKGPLDFQNGNVNANDEYIETYWSISYDHINRANSVIKKADQLKEEGVANQPLVERVKAEAMFLRAFYYFNLVRYFDDIPVTTTKTENDQDLPSNENGKQVALDLIIADLTIASDVLPDSYAGSETGRATKWAAMALLVKGYLQAEQWDEARKTAETIVNESGSTLFIDFADNFAVATENTGERLFEASVSGGLLPGEAQNAHQHFIPGDLPNTEGGVGWHWLNGTQAYRNKFDPNDKRIPGTFIDEYTTTRVGVNSAGELPVVKWDGNAPYNLSRFGGMVSADADANNPSELIFTSAWSAKYTEMGISNATLSEKNTVYLRLADVLLGHSEAANESGIGDPYFGINLVRRRAGIPELSGLSQEQLRRAIVDERVLEFGFEGEVYPELKRKSTFGGSPDYLGEYIQEFINTYNVDRTLSAKDYVLPLPLSEVLGNPNVTQNPLY